MTGNSTAYWVSGTAATQGGTSSARVFYTNPDPSNTSLTTSLLASGDTFAPGLTVSASGIGFDYDVAENGRRIHELLAAGVPTASDECIWADGQLLAREGSPAPDGTNWGTFSGVAINNAGSTLFVADTTGPTASDLVLVLDGTIVHREGDTLAGRTLGSALSAVALDNLGNAVFIWTAPETLFFRESTGIVTALLSVGDAIDTNADGTAEYTVTDFNASGTIGPGLDLADSGPVYLHVDLQDAGGATLAAVIGLARPGTPPPTCPPDLNNDGNLDPDDLADFIACYFTPPCNQADFNHDGNADPDDLADYIAAYFAGC